MTGDMRETMGILLIKASEATRASESASASELARHISMLSEGLRKLTDETERMGVLMEDARTLIENVGTIIDRLQIQLARRVR